MATAGGRPVMEKKNSSLMFRQITPPHGWKDDARFHYLRLTLPGFEAKNVTMHLDKYGHLVVRGDRQVSEHKYISFEESFDVPEDADIEEAEGMFEENQIYCITIPKKRQTGHAIAVPNIESRPNPEQHNEAGSFHTSGNREQPGEVWNPRANAVRNPLKKITGANSKKKTIFCFVVTSLALLAIAVVVIVMKLHHRLR